VVEPVERAGHNLLVTQVQLSQPPPGVDEGSRVIDERDAGQHLS
jgi:hypothetical protein